MGLFSFGGRGETFLTIVTAEGPGRMRINGLRSKDKQSKKVAVGHERTVCWMEFSRDGGMLDKGIGKASAQPGQAEQLLKDLPTSVTCRGVLDRLRDGHDSVGKWLPVS